MKTNAQPQEIKTLCLTADQFADLLIADDRNLVSFASRRRHLQQCGVCHAEFRRFESLLGGLRESATNQSASAQLKAQRLPQAVSHETRNAVWSLAAAALAIVAAMPFVHRQDAAAPVASVVIAGVSSSAKPDTPTAISDEALLDGISQDLSASVPSSLAPLDNPSTSQTTSDGVTRP